MALPDVDMLQVSKNSVRLRNEMLKFNPQGCRIIDYSEMRRLDTFFLDCQDYRDYYRDPYNKLHKPPNFRDQGPCDTKRNYLVKNFMEPVVWVTKTQPIFNFTENSTKLNLELDTPPWLLIMGRNMGASCTRFKR